MKNKILILGKGFIGSRIQEELGGHISGRMIYSYSDAREQIKKYSPKVVINCIGITGKNNVDDCEQVVNESLLANSFVPLMIAEACIREKIKLVHISSGCIFNYDYRLDRPLTEELIPDYFDLFYSRTKIYSDLALSVLSRKYPVLVARIRVPLDSRPSPKNLLNKLIKYKNIIDVPNSVTYIPDFLRALKHLIRIDAQGVYNIVNKSGLRYFELMDVYRRHVPGFNYNIITLKKLGLSRTNLILSTKKLEKTGFKVRDIHEVLEECVKKYTQY